MTDGRGYELLEATYPLVHEGTDAGVPMQEEIRCLLDAGWAWDGNKLVHPKDKGIWRMYQKDDSPKIGSPQRLDDEIERAVRAARQLALRVVGTAIDRGPSEP